MNKIKYKNIKLIELMVLGATVTAKYFCKQIFKWSTCQRHDKFFYSSDQQQTKSIEFLLVLTLEVMSALDLFRSTAQADSQCLSLYVLWKKKRIKKNRRQIFSSKFFAFKMKQTTNCTKNVWNVWLKL